MMNPEMMKQASEMMSKMSPEDMQKMMEMTKNMDPQMMQRMMANPMMAQQAQQQMANMSADDLKQATQQMSNMKPDELQRMAHQANAHMPPAPPPAAPEKVADRLRKSPMSIPADVITAAEEGEKLKNEGNAAFKAQDYFKACSLYGKGVDVLEKAITCTEISGEDKKAVVAVKDACHLNTANCRLKTKEYDLVVEECGKVLVNGENRKALYRRGQAYSAKEQWEPAYTDLKQAVKLDPSDEIVLAALQEVEGKLGKEKTTKAKAAPKAKAPAASSSGGGSSTVSAADKARVEQAKKAADRMADMKPEEMKEAAEKMKQMSPEEIQRMADAAGAAGMPGMSPEQIKQAGEMMANMPPGEMQRMAEEMKKMDPETLARMQQAQGGMGGGMGGPMGGMGPQDMDKAMDMMKNMDPEMMKQAAKAMGEMDPEMLRKMNPQMANMDAEQIKQAQEMMSSMDPAALSKMGEAMKGLQGAMNPDGTADPAKAAEAMANMSPDQLKSSVEAIKSLPPDMLEKMAAMTGQDPQKMQEQMANMDSDTMVRWATRFQYLAKLLKHPLKLVQAVRSMGMDALVLSGLVAALAVLLCGHLTNAF